MLCYRDKTFCSFYKDCKKECDRALTEDVKKKAKDFGLGVCQYVDKPECWEGE